MKTVTVADLQQDMSHYASGAYISEMSPAEQAAFWQRMIGRELCNFLGQVQEQLDE